MLRIRTTPKFWGFVILVMIVAFMASFLVTQNRLRAGAEKLAATLAARTALTEKAAALQDEIEFAQTDAYVERAARDQLGLLKPGEVRYVNGGN